MSEEWNWFTRDPQQLAEFVSDRTSKWVDGVRMRYDLLNQADGRSLVARGIYETLCAMEISYSKEKFDRSLKKQRIRKPREVFVKPKEGTCLDLALAFAGLCLANDLLPVVVVTDGHAFTMVSLTHGLADHKARKGLKTFLNALVQKDASELIKWIDNDKTYLAIECTGFARTKSLPTTVPEGRDRTETGTLPFKIATRAGREQLEHAGRDFQFALDVMLAHLTEEVRQREEPDYPEDLRGLRVPDRPPGKHLPCLVDRRFQVNEVGANLDEIDRLREPKPLVCVLDGGPDQMHECFIDRLESHELPRWLDGPVLRAFAALPAKYLSPSQFEADYWESLAEAVVTAPASGHPTSGVDGAAGQMLEAARKVIREHRGPVLISSDFTAEDDWRPSGRDLIRQFFEFWAQFSPLSAGGRLIVCLCVKYKDAPRPSWLPRLLRRDVDREVRDHLDELPGQFAAWTRLRCVKLTRLDNVPLGEALKLDDLRLVNEHTGGSRLGPDLRRFYERHCGDVPEPEREVPMKMLYDELEHLFKSHTPRGVLL